MPPTEKRQPATHLVWKRLDQAAVEYCRVWPATDQILVTADITGLDERTPFHVHYEITLHTNWQVQAVHVHCVSLQGEARIRLTKTDSGWHHEKGALLPAFQHCQDIDISLSPLTNTLPINRLSLPQGESRELEVLYLDLPQGDCRVDKQRYTHLDRQQYRYEGLSTGFTSLIEINPAGFVVNYPGLWTLVSHKEVFP